MRALFETEVLLHQVVRARCLALSKAGDYLEPLDFTREPHTPALAQRGLEGDEYTFQAFVAPVVVKKTTEATPQELQ